MFHYRPAARRPAPDAVPVDNPAAPIRVCVTMERMTAPGTHPIDRTPDGGATSVRRPRRRWTDFRLFVGVILIAASIAGVWAVVAASRRTAPVYVATHTIVPGEHLDADDLTIADVALGRLDGAYLTPKTALSGMVSTRTIPAGELVARDAVQPERDVDVTTVVVQSLAEVPSGVRTGTRVDVWVAAHRESGGYGTPRILVPDAVVASVSRDESMLGDAGASLELVIPRSDVADALEAIAGASAISVVPTGVQG
jgi:hypothetical protein